jgi:MscS family membrane protein
MQRKFEWLYRSLLVSLCVLLVWSVWRSAAQNSNDVEAAAIVTAGSSTNHPGALSSLIKKMETPEWVEKLAVDFPFLKNVWWGNELWKYLFSLIYIFLAFYASKFLDFLTRVWLKKWAEKTATKFDDLVLELLNGPIKVVAFVIFLRVGLDVFQWPPPVQTVMTKGFTVIVAISLIYMVLKFIDLLMSYWRQRTKAETDRAFDQQLFPIIRKSLKVFVIVVGALVTLDNMGINITAALASLSIGGLAVGLAAQDTLANLFGAVAVFADKPFRIGDRIKIENVEGAVEAIGLRSTRVRSGDSHLVAIPNKIMGNAIITNITLRPHIKTEMNIGLTYDTSSAKLKQAIELLKEIYGAHPQTEDLTVGFNKFADSSLNVQVIHWWKGVDQKVYLAGMQDLNLTVKERFDAEGISFAFPTQTIYLKQDSGSSAER